MGKTKKINYMIIFFSIIIYYIPSLFTKIYISVDEFSSIAVPAILSGHDWKNVLSLHSYHGLGYTILLTPIFTVVTDGIIAHHVLIISAIVVKIAMAELLFLFFNGYLSLNKSISTMASIAYTCGIFGCDEYGLSALSELPFAFFVVISIYLLGRYIKQKKISMLILSLLAITYTYTIHSRCLVFFIAIILTYVIYVLREHKVSKKMILSIGIFAVCLTISYLLLNCFQNMIYSVSSSRQLTNDPSMVMSASSYQLKKLLDLENIFEISKICLSLTTTQCMISLGVGATSLFSCIYIIIDDLRNSNKYEKFIVYLAYVSIFLIFGMNLSVGIQALGRIREGNYAWLTYIRYTEPFWVVPFIVFIYFFCTEISSFEKIGMVASVVLVNWFLLGYIAPLLNSSIGLNYSVLNRIFYSNEIGVIKYFEVFCTCAFVFSLQIVTLWNSKKYKRLSLCTIVVVLLVINYQYQDYYIQKQAQEYYTIDDSADAVKCIIKKFPHIVICGDSEELPYISKLQFICFNEKIDICDEETTLKENEVVFSDNSKCNYNNATMITLDSVENEYIYVSNEIFEDIDKLLTREGIAEK